MTFEWDDNNIRIIGAGYWRKQKKYYETQNSLHRRTARNRRGDRKWQNNSKFY